MNGRAVGGVVTTAHRTQPGSTRKRHAGSIGVLLVDDYELFRTAVRLLIESFLGHRVFEADSAVTALDIVQTKSVDVVLLDVRMPDNDGLWTLDRIRELRPDLPVLMLSHFDDAHDVRSSLDRGAAGYVVKGASVQQLVEAIDTALKGRGVYVHPMAAEQLIGFQHVPAYEQLTERELEVLKLLVEGATNEQIATSLCVTEKTVKTHLSAIFRKFHVSNRTQAATKAFRIGVAKP